MTDINYILEAEGSGLVARSQVNRLARLSERLVEPKEGIGGIFQVLVTILEAFLVGKRLKVASSLRLCCVDARITSGIKT